ncbi:MAG: hypothetical protein ACNA77_07125, partial [Opitutales bacterium]
RSSLARARETERSEQQITTTIVDVLQKNIIFRRSSLARARETEGSEQQITATIVDALDRTA